MRKPHPWGYACALMSRMVASIEDCLQDVCIERGIEPAPVIVSESGRALGSHHAILVFDVLSKCA